MSTAISADVAGAASVGGVHVGTSPATAAPEYAAHRQQGASIPRAIPDGLRPGLRQKRANLSQTNARFLDLNIG